MQYSRRVLTSVEQRGKITSLDLLAMLLLMQAKNTTGFLGCKHTLLAHVQPLAHQHPQVLLIRAAFDLFVSQPMLILGVGLTQVQHLVLGLIKPHEIFTGPLFKVAQVPLDDVPSFRCVNSTTQLGVICKFAEGALDLFVCVTNEDINTGPSMDS
ncbi:hypothetical protein WISP_39760 [Willisornis vidua]|uniref:Uncharacterized protein n=1 Tax=Willisornis vidua TaxID=1566151 RepID=A0ABQ9DI14_9PASS|nr:hypothetical protein WISP_39760 [Willisornis vidua]